MTKLHTHSNASCCYLAFWSEWANGTIIKFNTQSKTMTITTILARIWTILCLCSVWSVRLWILCCMTTCLPKTLNFLQISNETRLKVKNTCYMFPTSRSLQAPPLLKTTFRLERHGSSQWVRWNKPLQWKLSVKKKRTRPLTHILAEKRTGRARKHTHPCTRTSAQWSQCI